MGKGKIIVRYYESPCGMLKIGSFGDRLCLCDWQKENHSSKIDKRLERIFDAVLEEGTSPVIENTITQLEEYFGGKRKNFDIPLLFAGTEFQKMVWNALKKIGYGDTLSYKEMCGKIGKPTALRALANANGANAISIIVPCHRVIGNDGSLTGYGGGLDTKLKLLELERRFS